MSNRIGINDETFVLPLERTSSMAKRWMTMLVELEEIDRLKITPTKFEGAIGPSNADRIPTSAIFIELYPRTPFTKLKSFTEEEVPVC